MSSSAGQAPTPEKASKLLTLIAALGAAVISHGRSFFAMAGGMALLCQTALSSSFKGIILPGAKLGSASLLFQMVLVGFN